MKKTSKSQKTTVHARKKSGILMGSIAMLLAPFAGHADDYIVNGTADVTGAGYFDGLGGGNAILQSGQLNISIGGFTAVSPTTAGMNAWFDASTLAYNNGETVDAWDDISAGNHDAARQNGTPVIATNALNGLNVVQFRGNDDYFNLANNSFFSKEQFVVVRSPNANWSEHGAFLGRQGGRESNYLTQAGQQNFHSNQYPIEVWRNGTDVTAQMGRVLCS